MTVHSVLLAVIPLVLLFLGIMVYLDPILGRKLSGAAFSFCLFAGALISVYDLGIANGFEQTTQAYASSNPGAGSVASCINPDSTAAFIGRFKAANDSTLVKVQQSRENTITANNSYLYWVLGCGIITLSLYLFSYHFEKVKEWDNI